MLQVETRTVLGAGCLQPSAAWPLEAQESVCAHTTTSSLPQSVPMSLALPLAPQGMAMGVATPQRLNRTGQQLTFVGRQMTMGLTSRTGLVLKEEEEAACLQSGGSRELGPASQKDDRQDMWNASNG